MKLIDNILYVTFPDLVECGVSDKYLRKAVSQGTKIWSHWIKDPQDNRRTLFEYEALDGKYKDMIIDRFGDPYQRMMREPILAMVISSKEAHQYFIQYRYAEGTKSLPIDVVRKYVRMDGWLKMLYKVKYNKNIILKQLNYNKIPDFYKTVKDLIDTEKERGKDAKYDGPEQVSGSFSSSYSRIMMNVDKYHKQGYDFLIDKAYGNQHRAKIKRDDVSEALLLELIGHHNQYDDVFISVAYNKQADELGLEQISVSTVRVWREKCKHLITSGRDGWQKHNNKYARPAQRMRPSQPGYLWESDDNHMDLHFMGEDGNPYHRMKAIFVTDSHCDLILGYAYVDADSMPTDLVKIAYLHAMHYVRTLTGGWYIPHEIKTDRWRLKALQSYYSNIAHYYPTPVGSKNRGWLENLFGHVDWKRCLKFDADGLPANNYTGNNITAKNLGVNLELLRNTERLRPQVSEAAGQIGAFVHRMRHIDLKGKGSRQQRWLDKWNALPDSEKRPISDELFLALFGLKHELPTNRKSDGTNSITKSGVTITISGNKYKYEVPEALYLQNIGKQVDVMYDPFDMNRVLITGDEGLRFVAHAVEKIPGTFRDMKLYGEGGRTLLNKTINSRMNDVQRIAASSEERMRKLSVSNVDVEHVLRSGGAVPKEVMQEAVYLHEGSSKQVAESQGHQPPAPAADEDWAAQRRAYLSSKVDSGGYGKTDDE